MNDPPTGTNHIGGTGLAVNEGQVYTFAATGTAGGAFEFGFADAIDDLPTDHTKVDAPQFIRITSLPTNGKLKFNGSDAVVGTEYPAANIGQFTFDLTAPADADRTRSVIAA